jgi:hypothetical protein
MAADVYFLDFTTLTVVGNLYQQRNSSLLNTQTVRPLNLSFSDPKSFLNALLRDTCSLCSSLEAIDRGSKP